MTNLRHLFDRHGAKPESPAAGRAESASLVAARMIVGRTANAALLTDIQGRIQYINPAAEALIGLAASEAQGRPFDDLLKLATLDKRKSAELPVSRVIGDGCAVELPSYAIVKATDGRIIAVQGSIAPVFSPAGEILGTLIQLFDVSRLGAIPDRLDDPTTEDSLTGLVNRHEFEERVKRALKRARTQSLDHLLCYIDLDRFRLINDTFGHKFGDDVLQAVAFTMRSRTRDRDTVARLRGDEFAVLLENCKLTDGLRIADDILEAVRNLTFKSGSETVKVSASIGVATIDQTSEHFSDVLAQTDAACYRAKQNGKNRVEVFGEMDLDFAALQADDKSAAALANAMEENRFQLFLQPIHALREAEGRLEFFEVFTKMKAPNGDLIGPSYFISDAERHHLMPVLDRHIVKLVFESYREVYGDLAASAPAVWAINISGTSLRNRDFVDFIREQSRALKVPPEAICFEISETAALDRVPQAAQFIRSLKTDGFRFSLDDFGPALGSFGTLKGLTVDYVKIDGSFVREIARDRVSRGTVKAIQYLCNIIGVKTIAESAESEEVVATLRECGVNYAQGYALGAPISLTAHRKLGLFAAARKPGRR